MRRTLTMLSVMAMMVVLASGVTFAADIDCLIDACVGTRGDDQIRGTDNPETINALAGDDFVLSRGGDDTIYLDNGRDGADGAGGNDTIYGGDGNDGSGRGVFPLAGGEDNDTVYGGKGNDYINAAAFDTVGSVDYSYGDSGNDTIEARDNNEDIIDCGEGRKDTVYFDAGIDTVSDNCEVSYPSTSEPPV